MTTAQSLRAGALAGVLLFACGGRHRERDGRPVAGTEILPASTTDSLLVRADRARILGSESARVWLMMASDFQCPFCRQWHTESYAAIRDAYVRTGKVRLAYVNLPLDIHRNAWPAAEAAMCAAAQGHFWEMHDSLFATQDAWGERPDPQPFLDSLAARLPLDRIAFRACVTSHAMRPLIEADKERNEAAGVNSTPTFFIRGDGGRGSVAKIEGAQPLSLFRRTLDSAIAAQSAGSSR